MSYDPNYTRRERKLAPPKYEPIRQAEKPKQKAKPRISHTITPEGWNPK